MEGLVTTEYLASDTQKEEEGGAEAKKAMT